LPGTSNGSGQIVTIGGQQYELIYSMLSLEKIELQFGSLGDMQRLITDDHGQVRLDRPVIKLLIDVIHAGLLHHFDDTAAARREIASGIPPSELENIVEVFTVAFTDAFGELGEKALAQSGPIQQPGSPGLNGISQPPSRSNARKKNGKR
jgi:hypothetical protein